MTTDEYSLRPELLEREMYPTLGTISAAFLFQAVVEGPVEPPPPEFVFVPVSASNDAQIRAVAEWNALWECGTHRPESFRATLPDRLVQVIDNHPETNFRLVTLESQNDKSEAYVPLLCLLPLRIIKKHGLRPTTTWPFLIPGVNPRISLEHLSAAFAELMWPLLCPRSPASAFRRDEPVRLLSHNLDFWLPYLDVVIQRRMLALGSVPFEDDAQRDQLQRGANMLPPELGLTVRRPCFGGDAWQGEDDAREAAVEMLEVADEHGTLRGILDAIRSHRVQDDFSNRWSFLKADFERRLYSRRHKVQVTFVELNDTIPVHAPDAEPDPERRLIWQDFFSVLDPRERRVVVCLRNGATSATEIAAELGYANHSPVSKLSPEFEPGRSASCANGTGSSHCPSSVYAVQAGATER